MQAPTVPQLLSTRSNEDGVLHGEYAGFGVGGHPRHGTAESGSFPPVPAQAETPADSVAGCVIAGTPAQNGAPVPVDLDVDLDSFPTADYCPRDVFTGEESEIIVRDLSPVEQNFMRNIGHFLGELWVCVEAKRWSTKRNPLCCPAFRVVGRCSKYRS